MPVKWIHVECTLLIMSRGTIPGISSVLRAVNDGFVPVTGIDRIYDVTRRSHVFDLICKTYATELSESTTSAHLRIGPREQEIPEIADIINETWKEELFNDSFVASWYRYGMVALRIPKKEKLIENSSLPPILVPLEHVKVYTKYDKDRCEYTFKVFESDAALAGNERELKDVFIFAKQDPVTESGEINSACRTVIDHIIGFETLFLLHNHGVRQQVLPHFVHTVNDPHLMQTVDLHRTPAQYNFHNGDLSDVMQQSAITGFRVREHDQMWAMHQENAEQFSQHLEDTLRRWARNSENLRNIDIGGDPHIITSRPPVSLPPNHNVVRLDTSHLDNSINDMITKRLENICVPFGVSASWVLRSGTQYNAADVNAREIESMERELSRLHHLISRIVGKLFWDCFPSIIGDYASRIGIGAKKINSDIDITSDTFSAFMRENIKLRLTFMTHRKVDIQVLHDLYQRGILADPQAYCSLVLSTLGLSTELQPDKNDPPPPRGPLEQNDSDSKSSQPSKKAKTTDKKSKEKRSSSKDATDAKK